MHKLTGNVPAELMITELIERENDLKSVVSECGDNLVIEINPLSGTPVQFDCLEIPDLASTIRLTFIDGKVNVKEV